MNPSFLKRMPTARRAAVLCWFRRGAVLLVGLSIASISSPPFAGPLAPVNALPQENPLLAAPACMPLPDNAGRDVDPAELAELFAEDTDLPPQAGNLPLPPCQLEPPDQTYVKPGPVTLRWAPTVGTSSYRLEIRSDDFNGSSRMIDIDGDVTCITYSGLDPGYSYAWWVRVNDNTSGSCLGAFEFTLSDQPLPPITPRSVRASDGTSTNSITVEWEPTLRTAYYQIQRYSQGGAGFIDYARVSDQTTYTDPDALPGTIFEYRVLACNHVGCSAPSEPEGGWAGDCINFTAPQLVSPANGSEVLYTAQDPYFYLKWARVPGAPGYHLRLWDTDTGAVITDQILEGYDTEAYEVWDESGSMSWNVSAVALKEHCPPGPVSETWNFHAMQRPPPPVPVNLRASDGTYPDRILLRWEQPPSDYSLESWEIWRATRPDPQAAEQIGSRMGGDEREVTYEDRDIIPGTRYTYWVTACTHSDPCSEKSAPDSGYAGAAPIESSQSIFVPVIIR